MLNNSFEAYKIRRDIKRFGIEFKFKRNKHNEYKEPIEEFEDIGTIKGLYHEQNSNIQIITGDTTQTRTKKIPMILFVYEDAKCINLKPNDVLFFNNKRYRVQGIVNVQEWNIIGDISLEVVDSGIQA